jgi:hypothetical protein
VGIQAANVSLGIDRFLVLKQASNQAAENLRGEPNGIGHQHNTTAFAISIY